MSMSGSAWSGVSEGRLNWGGPRSCVGTSLSLCTFIASALVCAEISVLPLLVPSCGALSVGTDGGMKFAGETDEAKPVSLVCKCGSWVLSDSSEIRWGVPVAFEEIYEELEARMLLTLKEFTSAADMVAVVLVEAPARETARKLLLDREGYLSWDPRWDEEANAAQEPSPLLKTFCDPVFATSLASAAAACARPA